MSAPSTRVNLRAGLSLSWCTAPRFATSRTAQEPGPVSAEPSCLRGRVRRRASLPTASDTLDSVAPWATLEQRRSRRVTPSDERLPGAPRGDLSDLFGV